jgi:hypothetical protein
MSSEAVIGKILLAAMLLAVYPAETRAPINQPEPVAKVQATPLARATSNPVSAGKRGRVITSGVATWYDYVPGGAAAGPGLRRALGSDWRGTTVLACYSGDCVRVKLSDWCLCSKGNRVIDLDDAAFRALAPTSMGVIPVTVRLP